MSSKKLFNCYQNDALLVLSLVFSLGLSLYLGGAAFTPKLFIALVLLMFAVAQIGLVTTVIFSKSSDSINASESFIVGYAFASCFIYGISLIFHISTENSFLMLAIFLLPIAYVFKYKKKYSREITKFPYQVSIIFFIAVLISHKSLSSPVFMYESEILPLWKDYFIHGITISSFGSKFSSLKNLEIAGEVNGLYHYGSFILPSILESVLDMPGFPVATSFLLPFGLLVGLLGVIALSNRLFKNDYGYLAVFFIAFVPVYSFFIQSGWHDFFWMIFTAPGSGYAIGLSLVIISQVVLYCQNGSIRTLILILILLLALGFIRFHMLLLLAPAIFGILIIKRYLYFLRRYCLLLILGLFIFPLIFPVDEKVSQYLNWSNTNGLFYGVYLPKLFINSLQIPYAIFLNLVSILGAYIFIYPLSIFLYKQYNRLNISDLIPALLIVVYVILLLYAPEARNGDISEYRHRHFPLLYIVFGIYSWGYVGVIARNFFDKFFNWAPISLGLITIFLSFFYFFRSVNPAEPMMRQMPWAADYFNQSVSRDIQDAASFIRQESSVGNVMAMPTIFLFGLSNPIIQLISLTSMPGYLVRPELKLNSSDCIRDLTVKRLLILKAIEDSQSWDATKLLMRENGIRWLITLNSRPFSWDSKFSQAYKVFNGVKIYDAGNESYNRDKLSECNFDLFKSFK